MVTPLQWYEGKSRLREILIAQHGTGWRCRCCCLSLPVSVLCDVTPPVLQLQPLFYYTAILSAGLSFPLDCDGGQDHG